MTLLPVPIVRNIADLRRWWPWRDWGFWRPRRQRAGVRTRSYACRRIRDKQGRPVMFQAPTAQALAERLAAGYPAKENNASGDSRE